MPPYTATCAALQGDEERGSYGEGGAGEKVNRSGAHPIKKETERDRAEMRTAAGKLSKPFFNVGEEGNAKRERTREEDHGWVEAGGGGLRR